MFSAMEWKNNQLSLIDQRSLPHKIFWFACKNKEDVAFAIEQMVVRGAPAIACAAAFGLALDACHQTYEYWFEYKNLFKEAVRLLASTRPTAVNLFSALTRMEKVAHLFSDRMPAKEVREKLEKEALQIFHEDIRTCEEISEKGSDYLIERFGGKRLRLLTHCNTGSLATAGMGTALGVIKRLHQKGYVEQVYANETRPWFQGARLTAFELSQEGIPFELLADHAAGMLLKDKKIDAVIVGADRIAKNKDTANKIGTYSVAVLARFHDVPFFIAAPLSTFDPHLERGDQIVIEQRSEKEVTHIGEHQITPDGTRAFNPAFDVTEAHLISGFFTENGFS